MMRLLVANLCLLAAVATTAAAADHIVLGGSDEEDAILLRPRQLAEGPDGNLYALDTGDAFIKVFSPTGDHLRDLAGPGEGPGEFQRADGAAFGFTPAGLLYFTEYFGGHRWITLLDLDGDLVATIAPDLRQAYGIEKAAPLPDGRFLVQFSLSQGSEPAGDVFLYRAPRILRIVDDQGRLWPEIVRTDQVRFISIVPGGATLTLPFAPVFTWCRTPSGRIVWSDGLSPRLPVFDAEGRPQEFLQTPLPPAGTVTSDDLDRWRDDLAARMLSNAPQWWHRFGRAADAYTEALYPRPILTELDVTPAGHVLIRGRSEDGEQVVPYWLLDAEGALLAQCRVPAQRLVISARHLLFFTEDEDGYRLAHAVVRRDSEVASLSQLEAFFAGMEEN